MNKRRFLFLICVGVGFVFVLSGIHTVGNYQKVGVVRNESGKFQDLKPESEKTERELHRDRLLTEYATSMCSLDKLNITKKTKRLPDIIGIGVEKCGTGALRRLLSMNPMIKLDFDEPFYFGTPNYKKGPKFYKTFLPKVSQYELVFEKSPGYFNFLNGVPETMRKDVPNAKIILVLCDPTNRYYSDYAQEVAKGRQRQSFLDVAHVQLAKYSGFLNSLIHQDNAQLDYISKFLIEDEQSHILTKGLYYYYLKRWYNVYNRSEIYIVDGEELRINPAKVAKELQKFLDIPEFIVPEDLTLGPNGLYCFSYPVFTPIGDKCIAGRTKPQCMTTSKGRTRNTNSEKPTEMLEKIRKFYAPFNEKLYKYLGRKFDW